MGLVDVLMKLVAPATDGEPHEALRQQHEASTPVIDAELGEALFENEAQLALEIAAVARRNIELAYPPKARPARRDAHSKAHGCVRALFTVEDDLPSELAHGVFVPGKSYSAWIRFSNASGDPRNTDSKGDVRGMAIKLMGVPGDKLLPEEKDAQTQDFLLIDHPVFIVDDPASYRRFLTRSASSSRLLRLLAPLSLGFRGLQIARAISQATIQSPLQAHYHSTTAYQLGTGERRMAVKFSARPRELPDEKRAGLSSGPDFLRAALVRQLSEGTARFDFLVQPRTSRAMSVERVTVEWPEAQAPSYKVATIMIPRQTFTSPAQDAFCESLSFTPWHCLPQHRPLGVQNRVRRVVYEETSRARHAMNRARRAEPLGDELFV